MRAARSTTRSLLFVVLVAATAGCGSSSGSAKASAVPPPDGPAVAEAATPLLASFGLQVQRSSVEEKAGPLTGTELNLYVRPTRTEAVDVYANRFMPLTVAVIPTLFAKYPAIQWIDLCQEPAKSSGAWETVPVTRLEISRTGAGRVDWQRADLATVLALQRTRRLEVTIDYHNGVGGTRVWKEAAARALTLDG